MDFACGKQHHAMGPEFQGVKTHKVPVTLALAALALAVACGNPNGLHSGLNVLSGANLSDTVGSILKPPLTVQLVDGDLQPLSGRTVYFNTGGRVLVAPLDQPGSGINRMGVTTDASGQAADPSISSQPT